MIALFINPHADTEIEQRIKNTQRVIRRRRNDSVNDNQTHVFDIDIHRIQIQQLLKIVRQLVHRIKNSGHVRDQSKEHLIQVLNVTEKHKQRRQNGSDSDVHNQKTQNRKNQQKHRRPECNPIEDAECKINQKRKSEVHQRRHILGQKKEVLRHIDLRKDLGVAHQRLHAVLRGFLVIRQHDITRKQVGRVVRNVLSEEIGENDMHHQQRQKRRQHGPCHPKHASLVLLLEITFDQFLKHELVFLNIC